MKFNVIILKNGQSWRAFVKSVSYDEMLSFVKRYFSKNVAHFVIEVFE